MTPMIDKDDIKSRKRNKTTVKMTANKLLKALKGYGTDGQAITMGILKGILKDMIAEEAHQQLLDSMADLQDNKFREV